MGIQKSKIKYFDNTFSATVENNAFKVKGRRYGSPNFLTLLEVENELVNKISFKFIEGNRLLLVYKDGDSLKSKEFSGQFKGNGYYEIFLRNDSKVVPLIYGRHNINRIRIAMTNQNGLIIDNEWNESGNLLFIGVGDKGRRQSFFNFKPNLLATKRSTTLVGAMGSEEHRL